MGLGRPYFRVCLHTSNILPQIPLLAMVYQIFFGRFHFYVLRIKGYVNMTRGLVASRSKLSVVRFQSTFLRGSSIGSNQRIRAAPKTDRLSIRNWLGPFFNIIHSLIGIEPSDHKWFFNRRYQVSFSKWHLRRRKLLRSSEAHVLSTRSSLLPNTSGYCWRTNGPSHSGNNREFHFFRS